MWSKLTKLSQTLDVMIWFFSFCHYHDDGQTKKIEEGHEENTQVTCQEKNDKSNHFPEKTALDGMLMRMAIKREKRKQACYKSFVLLFAVVFPFK